MIGFLKSRAHDLGALAMLAAGAALTIGLRAPGASTIGQQLIGAGLLALRLDPAS